MIFILYILYLLLIFSNCSNDNTNHATFISSEIIIPESGDIIFRKGKGFFSPFISDLDKKYGFSHLGVIVVKNNKKYVIHSDLENEIENSGVRIEIFENFIDDAIYYEIKKNIMKEKNKILFLNSITDLLTKKTMFDDKFDLEDLGAKVYCSELLWIAAKKSGSDVPEPTYFLGKPYISISDLYEVKWLK